MTIGVRGGLVWWHSGDSRKQPYGHLAIIHDGYFAAKKLKQS
jgi:hypothetical protein